MIFISHASADLAAARKVEAALGKDGQEVWLDASSIQLGALLRRELHTAIERSSAVVLLWSAIASQSRWVAAEILTSFHMDRFIFPCVLDETLLPQFLASGVHLDMRRNVDEGLRRLVDGVRKAPRHANDVPLLMAAESAGLREAIVTLADAQQRVTNAVVKREVDKARKLQVLIDPVMLQAEEAWRYERMIRILGGYHRKNAYMLKHWEPMQAGVNVKDPLLIEAERCFFDALFVDPMEVSALNGLGSILILERELDAAEFFVRKAIALSKKQGLDYGAAEFDLTTILRYKGAARAAGLER